MNGSTLVTVFQTGRIFAGGAAGIGFGVSRDGGRHWRSGILPSLTTASSPSGAFARASDPVVAWDALHARWLVATLGLAASTAVTISTSPDGATWSAPVSATVSTPTGSGESLDKEWLACDNGRTSPFFGRCYLVYTDFRRGGMALQSSTDGGVTWTAPLTIPVQGDVPGPQLAVRPNGELVLAFLEGSSLVSIRSGDGGASFGSRDQVATLQVRSHPFRRDRLRVFPLPSGDADSAGTVYLAWFDCRFRPGCRANDAVFVRSTAPGLWTRPRRIPLVAPTSSADVVLPSLGVDPVVRGRLALTYYTLSSPGCDLASCRLNAWQATSRTSGLRWSRPRRLNAIPMRLGWLPETSSGRMVGDYFGAVVSGGRAVSIAAIARAPRGGRFNQAMNALSAIVR